MRKLSLWLSLLFLGGIGYVTWPKPPTAPARPVSVDSKPAERVPFLVKVKTRQIFDEWQKLDVARSTGDRQASWTKINLAMDEIRRRLHSDGLFASEAVREAMRSAAREIGYQGQQVAHVIDGVLAGDQSRPSSKGSALVNAIGQMAEAANQSGSEKSAER